ncbi:MAG: family 16 glycosylhydrolase [Puniceicoccaceae bacterium]
MTRIVTLITLNLKQLVRSLFLSSFYLAATPFSFGQGIDPASDPAVQPHGNVVDGYRLSWSDEFNDGSIDESKWYYRTGSKLWSTMLPANNSESDGLYRIHLRKEQANGKEYTGGGIITKGLFRYGYYETRMKTPKGEGWHSSFWMMRDKVLNTLPRDSVHIELDVVENDSSDPHHYQVDAHQWLPHIHRKIGTKQIYPEVSLAEDFHVYGMEFTPTELRYFFNGELVRVAEASQFPHNDFNVWLSCLAAKLGPKTTAVDDTQLPAETQYDYIRIFEKLPVVGVEILSPDPVNGIALPDTDHALQLLAKAVGQGSESVASVAWSKSSGPGEVKFDDPASPSTSARFSEPGAYVLQCLPVAESPVQAATISVSVAVPVVRQFIHGVSGQVAASTTLSEAEPDKTMGRDDDLRVGKQKGKRLRSLLSFDLRALPADAELHSVELKLWKKGSYGGAAPVIEIRQLLSEFSEGDGDGFRVDGVGTGSTWKDSQPGKPWAMPGGDFLESVLSSLGPEGPDTPGYMTFPSSAAMVATALDSLRSGESLNLLLLAPEAEAGANGVMCFASDVTIAERRPILEIAFTGNSLPVIEIGPLVRTSKATLELPAKVSGSSRSYWELISGPGEAEFVDRHNPTTAVIFDQPGSYVLRLNTTNIHGISLKDVRVVVAPDSFPSFSGN